MLHVISLSFALAADASAVSATLGAARPGGQVALRAAAVFGVFQGGMAGVGAFGGLQLAKVIGPWLGLLASLVLLALGIRMLAMGEDDDVPEELSWKIWGTLGLATSVDALAAGVSLPLFDVPVTVSAALIGAVTAALSGASALAGGSLGQHFGERAQRVGGLALVGLGGWSLWSTFTSG